MKQVRIEREGEKFFATIDGSRFLVGKRTKFTAGAAVTRGLHNVGHQQVPYRREDHREAFGLWADFMSPTVTVEGGHLDALNTYDRARFTFGFLQFAAHVPGGDFVRYLRALLRLPLASEYFPDLALNAEGHVARLTGSGLVELENRHSTEKLMDYLNPSSADVEDAEVVNAAKLIHWVRTDPEHRRAQVEIGVSVCKGILAGRANQLQLNGRADTCCLVIMDILHQGRGSPSIPKIKAALASPEPMTPLLEIGKAQFPSRVEGLATAVESLVSEGSLGRFTYQPESNDFIGGGDSDDDAATTIKIREEGENQLWLHAGGQRRPLHSPDEVSELRRAGLLDGRETSLSRAALEAIPIMPGATL
jgi:hypothetical protein